MKRLFLLIVVVMLVYWVLARHRSTLVRPAGAPGHRNGPHYAHDREARRHLSPEPGTRCSRRCEKPDTRFAMPSTRRVTRFIVPSTKSAARCSRRRRQAACAVEAMRKPRGFRCRIVPGTRVTEAQAVPPAPPTQRRDQDPPCGWSTPRPVHRLPANADVGGNPDARTERSRRPPNGPMTRPARKLRETITAWLDPDVPSSWALPERAARPCSSWRRIWRPFREETTARCTSPT